MKGERNFNVGDVCRIRSWEDMQREFGLNGMDEIDCDYSFVEDMKYLCGKQFTIKAMEAEDGGIRCFSFEDIENGWAIGTDMLELFCDCSPEFEGESIDALVACLGW